MGDYIIITDRDQLKSLIQELIADLIPPKNEKTPTNYLNVQGLVGLLVENGYHISPSQIYKLTSSNTIPYMKIGNKLLFSRSDIFGWLETHKNTPKRTQNPIKVIQADMGKFPSEE